jgi:hypothetical protein
MILEKKIFENLLRYSHIKMVPPIGAPPGHDFKIPNSTSSVPGRCHVDLNFSDQVLLEILY